MRVAYELVGAGIVMLVGCGAKVPLQGTPPDEPPPPPIDEGPPIDEALRPFGPPMEVNGASDPALAEDDATLSSDQLTMVFALVEAADMRKHLYLLSRASTAVPFSGPATRLGFNVAGETDQTPRFSLDDTMLFFSSSRTAGTTDTDIYSIPRNANNTFGTPALVGGVNDTGTNDKTFTTCTGNRYAVVSQRGGAANGDDIYEGVIGGGPPTPITNLNTTMAETGPFLTEDCLTMYFASNRNGPNRIFVTTRASVAAAWSDPIEVTDFSPGATEAQSDPWLSRDGKVFALTSNRNAANNDVFLSTR